MDTVKLGRNGQLSLPRAVMKRLHLHGNETLLLDVSDDGVIRLRPAAVLPIEMYTPQRIEEFEQETVVDADTRAAVREALTRSGRDAGGASLSRRERPDSRRLLERESGARLIALARAGHANAGLELRG